MSISPGNQITDINYSYTTDSNGNSIIAPVPDGYTVIQHPAYSESNISTFRCNSDGDTSGTRYQARYRLAYKLEQTGKNTATLYLQQTFWLCWNVTDSLGSYSSGDLYNGSSTDRMYGWNNSAKIAISDDNGDSQTSIGNDSLKFSDTTKYLRGGVGYKGRQAITQVKHVDLSGITNANLKLRMSDLDESYDPSGSAGARAHFFNDAFYLLETGTPNHPNATGGVTLQTNATRNRKVFVYDNGWKEVKG